MAMNGSTVHAAVEWDLSGVYPRRKPTVRAAGSVRQHGFLAVLNAPLGGCNIKDCMDFGMDEFLAKPIRRPALFERHFNP
ncbi:hypothetical protein PG988_011125 [Apiospora saccharicola]